MATVQLPVEYRADPALSGIVVTATAAMLFRVASDGELFTLKGFVGALILALALFAERWRRENPVLVIRDGLLSYRSSPFSRRREFEQRRIKHWRLAQGVIMLDLEGGDARNLSLRFLRKPTQESVREALQLFVPRTARRGA